MKPFSDNIIFFDTEFTYLDAKVGELLSIGMVKPLGEELYIEFEYSGEPHPWVIKNVLPYLTQEKTSVEDARTQISKFVGESKPYLMAYVNQFDAIFWYQLFGDPMAHPAFWIPMDFASILFAEGIDPNSMGHDAFFSDLGIDKSAFNSHNALDDAKLLMQTYYAFAKKAE